jgi:hypothetical protein
MIELQGITDGTLRKRWSLKEFEEFHRGVKPPKAKSLYDYPFGKVFLEELVPIMVWLQRSAAKPDCMFQLKQTAAPEEGWDARIEADGDLLRVQITTIGPAWRDSEGRVKHGEATKAMLRELKYAGESEGRGPMRLRSAGSSSSNGMESASEIQDAFLHPLVEAMKKKGISSDPGITLLIYINEEEWLDDKMLDIIINEASLSLRDDPNYRISRNEPWPKYKSLFVF